jgi:hypothetical protein
MAEDIHPFGENASGKALKGRFRPSIPQTFAAYGKCRRVAAN